MTMTLEQDKLYDLNALREAFIGWTKGDGSGQDGYYLDYYFYAGRYLGPDNHGIEPIFAIDDEK